MAASTVAKRKTPSRPKLSAVPLPAASRPVEQITFAESDFSLIGDLVNLSSWLPKTLYDANLGSQQLEVDEDRKDRVLEQLSHTSFAVTGAIKLIGRLLAGQDKQVGAIGHEELVELGYAINGLGHIVQAIEEATFQINESRPTEPANG